MKTKLQNLERIKSIKDSINSLDREKIYLIFFDYKSSLGNFWKNPLLIFMKLYNFFKKESQDHVAFICDFDLDEDDKTYSSFIFEANMKYGMRIIDLSTRLEEFEGTYF